MTPTINYLIKIFIGILPVAIFLLILIFLDSYKLVKLRSVLLTIFFGFIIALVCLFINMGLLELLHWTTSYYSKYAAPLVEEIFKAMYVIFIIRLRRVGFLVDAAICGFALGAGFAIIENVYIFMSQSDSNLIVWVVRGFGTAVMHGGTTAIFAIVSKSFSERLESEGVRVYLPGLGMAAIIHSMYNHFFITPVFSSIVLLIGLPLIMIIVFQQSEKATRKWLGVGFDTDAEILDMITTGNITETRLGRYLLSLKEKFPGEVVADMLCLLRIHLEISIKAKGRLMMREAGFDTPRDPAIKEKFDELRYLEKNIGRTGRLTILPFLRWNSRDLWQLYMLSGE